MGSFLLRVSIILFLSGSLCRGNEPGSIPPTPSSSKVRQITKLLGIGTVVSVCGVGLLAGALEVITLGGVSRTWDEPGNLLESDETTYKRRAANRQEVFNQRMEFVGNSTENSRECFLKKVRDIFQKRMNTRENASAKESFELEMYSLYLREAKNIPMNSLLNTLEQEEVSCLIGEKVAKEPAKAAELVARVRKVREILTFVMVEDLIRKRDLDWSETRFYLGHNDSKFNPQFGTEAPFKIRGFSQIIPDDKKEHDKLLSVLEEAIKKARRFY